MKKLLVIFSLFSFSFSYAQNWYPLGNGVNSSVGDFTIYNSKLTALRGDLDWGILQWNGTHWDSIESKTNGYCYALTTYNGNLIEGGHFDSAGGRFASKIAEWNGTSWSPLGSGLNTSPILYTYYVTVTALTVYNGNLIAGGWFDSAGGTVANDIAEWNGTSWLPLGNGITNGDAGVLSLAVYNGNLIAGGEFTMAGGQPVNNIAEWNGTSWSALGSGVAHGVVLPFVYALAVYNGNLIAAGEFDSAGGKLVNNIAAWNGTSWSALGNGIRVGNTGGIYSLAVFNGNLIVGGTFDSAGSNLVNDIAEWNGSSWSSLGKGMSGSLISSSVSDLAVYNSSLYAGGTFDSAGGKLANNIAEWCPGTCPTGINEITESSSVNIFPNPNNGVFTIALSHPALDAGSQTIEVFNVFGERIFSEILRSAQDDKVINLNGQPNGVYFYRVLNETGGLVGEGKLIIEK